MTKMPAFQVLLYVQTEEDVAPDELEATAEAVLRGVQKNAVFVALGPVVSVDFEESRIELDCTVCGETSDDVHAKMARISDVMLESANGFEYQGSSSAKLEPALV
jgi:hypothetical protein